MKRLLFTTFLSSFFTLAIFSQGMPGEIADCFRKGNAALLRNTLASKINLSLPGITAETDIAKAESQLDRFFKTNAPAGFEIAHKSDKGDSGFLIGTLNTTKGKYRVHLLMRKTNNKYLIHQIRIENFNE
ncbi:MAG: DUF4783 domain-containing protein [Bacteroidales bacterium]